MLPRPRAILIYVVLGTAAFAWPESAVAQQRFELGDDDTWIEVDQLDPVSPEGILGSARKALAEGRAARTEHLATQWIDRHPAHPLIPEAYLLRGDALVVMGEPYEALYDYELVARLYPGSEAFVSALERELALAKRFAAGEKRKLGSGPGR